MSKKEAGGVICGVLELDCGELLGELGTKIEDTLSVCWFGLTYLLGDLSHTDKSVASNATTGSSGLKLR